MLINNEKEWSVEYIFNDMKIGWNLGNSLDSPIQKNCTISVDEYETSWGNPKTTKEMILKVIEAGFNVIRIPVTWWEKVDIVHDYKIDVNWLKRVQEVVDYAYSEGVYVIIDIHYEDEWLYLGDVEAENRAMLILEKIWKQIAERFKSYDYHLVFETMNETRFFGGDDEWDIGTVEGRKTINKYNEVAVKAIRSTGNNNRHRLIMIKTIGARYNVEGINDIVVPDNDSMIALAVHLYVPYFFCMRPDQTAYWGTVEEREEMSDLLESMAKAAEAKGLRLIIGEFGAIDKNNEEIRADYAGYIVSEAKKRGIVCIIWDNNISDIKDYQEFSYCIFNRRDLSWNCPLILKAIIDSSMD